jgi:LPS export ABC transporter protein LptC
MLLRALVLLAIIATILWWFLPALPGSPTEAPPPSAAESSAAESLPDPQSEPDLRLGNATITEFSATGEIRYQLDAEAMARYEDHDETLLGAPSLQIEPEEPGSSPWNVVSLDGAIRQIQNPDGSQEPLVLLRRSVVLKQLDAITGHPLLTIRSEMMDLYPDRQFASSPTDVMIDSDVGRTQASSMEGNLESGKLLLSSEPQEPVHTIVLPNQFKKQSSS